MSFRLARGVIAALIVALGLPVAAEVMTGASAEAQVWKPEKAKKRKRRKPRKRKPPRKEKPAPKEDAAADDEALDDEEVLIEEEPIDGDEVDPDEEPPDDDEFIIEEEAGDEIDGDDGGDADSFSLEGDDLLDVGPDADIDASDLTMDGTTGNTRLETRAMTFVRSMIDTVHDEVPPQVEGVTPFGEEVLTFRWHGRAEGITRFGRRLKVQVAGRFDAELALDSNSKRNVERFEAEVWDTYADLYVDHLDLRFGKQIITWGTADLLRPNDVINPRDLRRGFLGQPDDFRRPIVALSARAYDGPISITGIWVPVADTNEFELLDSDWALLGPNAATPLERRVGAFVSALQDDPMVGLAFSGIRDIEDEPDFGIESGELGTELTFRLPKVDLHGFFFWGHERAPRVDIAPELQDFFLQGTVDDLTPDGLAMRVQELAAMGIPAVQTSYRRRIHAGGAFATRLEPIGFKLDAGYTLGATTPLVTAGAGPLLARQETLDRFSGTVSVDYDRGSSFTFVLEANYTKVLQVPADRTVYQFDGDQQTIIGSRFEWNPGSGPVTLKAIALVEARSEPSYAVHPAIRLSGHDNLSIEIGAVIYGGPANSFGGIADHNDQIQLTAQYGL